MLENALVKNKIWARVIAFAVAVAGAVGLPQLFHFLGYASGTGAMLGSIFLPMHLTVLAAALVAGPIVGFVSGAVSPLLSFAISGMPAAVMLPFMAVELAVYGLVCGLLRRTKIPVIFQLIIGQAAGRLVKAAVVAIAFYAFNGPVTVASVWSSIWTGLPGIVLQWALIPLLVYRLAGLRKYYD